MQLLHLAQLTAVANPHADANTLIITEHFGGAVTAAELAAVRHLVALLDGSAPSFGDALYVSVCEFCFFGESLRRAQGQKCVMIISVHHQSDCIRVANNSCAHKICFNPV